MIQHMLLSKYKAGREWDPHQDPQIYFVKSGESLGRDAHLINHIIVLPSAFFKCFPQL